MRSIWCDNSSIDVTFFFQYELEEKQTDLYDFETKKSLIYNMCRKSMKKDLSTIFPIYVQHERSSI